MVKTIKLARVEQHAFFSQGLLRKIWLRAVSCQDNRFDVQAVFRGKLVVALVVTGTAITAPVPYSINTKFAAQTGISSPVNG